MWGSSGLGKATTNTTSVESGLTYNLIKTRLNSFMQGIGMHVYNIQNVALFSQRVVIHPF